MAGDEILRQKRAHGMADQDHWATAMIGAHLLAKTPEIADAFVPAVALGEKTLIAWPGRRSSVAAMIVGIDRVAIGRQHRGEAMIASGMLGEAVGDLHHGLGRRGRNGSSRSTP